MIKQIKMINTTDARIRHWYKKNFLIFKKKKKDLKIKYNFFFSTFPLYIYIYILRQKH